MKKNCRNNVKTQLSNLDSISVRFFVGKICKQ